PLRRCGDNLDQNSARPRRVGGRVQVSKESRDRNLDERRASQPTSPYGSDIWRVRSQERTLGWLRAARPSLAHSACGHDYPRLPSAQRFIATLMRSLALFTVKLRSVALLLSGTPSASA